MIAKRINPFVFSKTKKKIELKKTETRKRKKGIKVFHFAKRKAEKNKFCLVRDLKKENINF